jgi:hypothetical protein
MAFKGSFQSDDKKFATKAKIHVTSYSIYRSNVVVMVGVTLGKG